MKCARKYSKFAPRNPLVARQIQEGGRARQEQKAVLREDKVRTRKLATEPDPA